VKNCLFGFKAVFLQAVAQRARGEAEEFRRFLLGVARALKGLLDEGGLELRDAILSVSGELNDRLGGPGYQDFDTFVHNSQFYSIQDKIGPEFQRRTVYRTWIRSGRSPLLDVFDCPDPSTKTPQRAVTVTPLQALSLSNNSLVLRMSDRLAKRIAREAGPDPAAQAERLGQLAYLRPPTADEQARFAQHLAAHGLSDLCRIVLNSSEFLYLD